MQHLQLPAPVDPPVPYFDVSVTLDDTAYTLSFHWNDRLERWFVQVLDEPGQTVLMGDVCLVTNFPLYRSRTVRTPPGLLMAYDTSGKEIDPGLSDLGARVQLYYLTEAELAAGA